MKHLTRTILLACIATFALSAVAASSASAAPEWYVKKKGTYEKLTAPVKVSIEGTFESYDVPARKGVLCNIHVGAGEIKTGGTGTISELETRPEECKPAAKQKNELTGCKVGKITNTVAARLPWATSLYKEGTEARQKILSGGNGTPYFVFECSAEWDECPIAESTHIINNVLGGLVEAGFDAKSGPRTKCSYGGKEAGEFGGTIKFKPTAEEKTKGIEAIKVE
jgi:hypothetical protein